MDRALKEDWLNRRGRMAAPVVALFLGAMGATFLACRPGEPDREGADVAMSPTPPTKATGLVDEVRRQLAARHSSKYAHKTRIDEGGGHFEYDCSGLVAYALRGVAPAALDEIPRTSSRPVAREYHDFFLHGARSSRWWEPIVRTSDLAPGDLVVWLEPEDTKSSNTGHIVIVDAAPTIGAERDEVAVTVIDSARSGHGKNDSRQAGGAGSQGIGRGPIVLQVDANGAPLGFRWSPDDKSKRHAVSIAMGRLKR